MKKIKVALLTDVEGVGEKYSIIEVKPGFARNYLIPQGLAYYATPSIIKHFEEIRRQKQSKEERIRQEYLALAKKLNESVIKIPVKASPKGKIFGSVSNIQIAEILSEMGYKIPKQNIKIIGEEIIKEVGEYTVEIKLYRDITAIVKVQVVAD